MQKNFWNDVAEYVKNNRFRSVWRKIAQVLGCVVVFCTTYALILPAITMEQKSYCGLEEHVHTKACYELVEVPSELICSLVEIKEITDDTTTGSSEAVQADIITGSETEAPVGQQTTVSDGDAEEVLLHTHTEECYGVPKELPLTCTLEEDESHTHDFLCYGTWKLVCTKEVHSHSLACFSNPEADVETEVVWENMVNHLNLTGVWKEDVVTIARSQLGYKESTLNYAVNENADMMGYTRYGAWSGKPYMEWNSAFVDFCIFYAGIIGMPVSEDCGAWVDELGSRQLYHEAAEYVPAAGNLMFLDRDGDGKADNVSIVTEVTEATEEEASKVCVVAGDVDGQVQYITYEMTEAAILGYGILPKQPAPYFVYMDSRVQVEVVLPEDSQVPRNAQLVVNPIGQESGNYTGMVEQAQEVVEGEITQIQFYDISFYTHNQEYIPVNDKAQVTIRMAENMEAENTVVLHYDESQEAPVIVLDDSTEQDMVVSAGTYAFREEPAENMNTVVSFETEGFSTFAVVGVVSGTYEAQVLDELWNLYGTIGTSGKTYMIFSYKDEVNNALDNNADTRVALRAETITVQEDVSTEERSDYRSVSRLKGVEVVYEAYGQVVNKRIGTVTAARDNGLLWRFAQSSYVDGNGATINAFTIQSVSTGQYLSINGNGDLELSGTPYHFTSRALYGASATPGICFNGVNTNNYVAFFDQSQRPNKEQQHVFTATTIEGSMNDINEGNPPFEIKMTLAEFNDGTNNTVVEEEKVTNLAGKIVAMVAVNNTEVNENIIYPAVGSNRPYGTNTTDFAGIDVFSASVNEGSLIIGNEDDSRFAQTAWEFESTGVPGTYYIKVGNIYADGSKDPINQQNLYLNISTSALSTSTTKQPIEVVMANIISGEGTKITKNVVCLRTLIDGSYYTIQLIDNIGDNDFRTGNNPDLSYRANHMVLVDLADTEPAQFRDWIDEIPLTADFDAATKLAGTTFAQQVEYRAQMRELAMKAKKYYDDKWGSLSTTQKNFVGEKRIAKLLNDLEWLWREDPGVVEPAAPDAKVKLFNYDAGVNNDALATGNFFQFFSWDSSEKNVDGQQNDTNILKRIVMRPVLGENGYPEIVGGYQRVDERDENNQIINTYYEYVPVNDGELDYLFQAPYQVAEMEDGGGLFRQDAEGNYYYYSDMNAAWYSEDENKIILYDTVVRPEYTRAEYEVPNSETYDSRSNFFPFNEVVGNVIYDYPNGPDETTVKTQYDNHTNIQTGTAYLNAPIDLWFGMTIEYDFFIPKDGKVNGEDMVFKFHGDDDVFVYVDDVLVLDIGGTHEARSGSINFTTGAVTYQNVGNELLDGQQANVDGDGNLLVTTEITTLAELYENAGKTNVAMDGNTLADYTMHNLKFFYVERGGTYSYAGIEFNMPPVPEDTLELSKEISTEEGVSVIDANLNYTFRVKSVINGNITDEYFIKEGASYNVYRDDELVRTDIVKPGGLIILKAGEKAKFFNIPSNTKQFVVEEMTPKQIAAQYSFKFRNYVGDEVDPNSVYEENGYMVYQTPVYTLGASQDSQNIYWSVICDNVVDSSQLDTLKITKRAGEGTTIDPNKDFRIKVQVGNDGSDLISLPIGTSYTVTTVGGSTETRTVDNSSGMITLRAGETATIQGFLAGTYWQVEEDLSNLSEGEHYTPFYSMQVNNGNEITGNTGTFTVRDTIEFFVTNFTCDFLVEFPLSKQTIGNTGNASFTFAVEEGTWDVNTGWTCNETWNPVSITVNGGDIVQENVRVGGYKKSDLEGATYYYKVYEKKNSGNFIYDESFYILEVQTSTVPDNSTIEGHKLISEVTRVWKNGTEPIEINNPNAILFTNYKASNFSVEKEVVNFSDENYIDNREFEFVATVKRNGSTFTDFNEPDDGSYSVADDGTISFKLTDGERVTIPVPVDATVIVTETFVRGYDTDYRVIRNSNPEELKHGLITEEISMNGDDITVKYINRTGYELPATGGSGTHLYLIGGLFLSLAAGGLLLMKRKKHM